MSTGDFICVQREYFERAFDFFFDDEDIDRHERFLAYLGVAVEPRVKEN